MPGSLDRVFHVVVRCLATITLAILAAALMCTLKSNAVCREIANGSTGKVLIFWMVSMSLLLPIAVTAFAWSTRKQEADSKAIRIDAAFSFACLLLFCATILYTLTHFAMF